MPTIGRQAKKEPPGPQSQALILWTFMGFARSLRRAIPAPMDGIDDKSRKTGAVVSRPKPANADTRRDAGPKSCRPIFDNLPCTFAFFQGDLGQNTGNKKGLVDEPQTIDFACNRLLGLPAWINQCVGVCVACCVYTLARGHNSPWGTCVIPLGNVSVCLTKYRCGGRKEYGTPPAFGRRAAWHQAVAGSAQTLSTNSRSRSAMEYLVQD